MGINIFWGKHLIGGREFCVWDFDPFFLECSKLFLLQIGLKTCGRELYVNKIYATEELELTYKDWYANKKKKKKMK